MDRKITTFFEDADGSEPDVTVDVETESRGVARVTSDLDALGVPESEQGGVRERAIELYWAAEHSDWLRTPEGEGA